MICETLLCGHHVRQFGNYIYSQKLNDVNDLFSHDIRVARIADDRYRTQGQSVFYHHFYCEQCSGPDPSGHATLPCEALTRASRHKEQCMEDASFVLTYFPAIQAKELDVSPPAIPVVRTYVANDELIRMPNNMSRENIAKLASELSHNKMSLRAIVDFFTVKRIYGPRGVYNPTTVMRLIQFHEGTAKNSIMRHSEKMDK